MDFPRIACYSDFRQALLAAGFSLSGDGDENSFSLCSYFDSNIVWHTGDPLTDPWLWRMRIVSEDKEVAYGKFFRRKGGFITREWVPAFLSLRRDGYTAEDFYYSGNMSKKDYDIFCLIKEEQGIPYHRIKARIGAKGLDNALAKLQAGMFICISGQTKRLSKKMEPYGWFVNTYCIAEEYWDESVFTKASSISKEEAYTLISQRLLELRPGISPDAIDRFLRI